MILVKSPITTCLPAEDLGRAKDFYQDRLGLKFVETGIPNSLTFEAGNGTQIFLYKREVTQVDYTAASFKVEDVKETVNELKAKDVVFESYDMVVEETNERIKTDENNIAHFGLAQAAWFKDSEGNILSIANH